MKNAFTAVLLAATAATASLIAIAPSAAQETPVEVQQPAALSRIDPERAVLVLVDFTDGLFPIVDTIGIEEMLNNAVATAKIAQTFDIPIMILGDEGGFYGQMHPAIKDFAPSDMQFPRTTPSAWQSGGFREALEATGRTQIIIGGITTDSCTSLTSLDLLREGYEVFVVADISGADSELAEQAALMRLRDAGAVTVGWSMLGSELLSDWETPEGEALATIYGRHLNGPNTSVYGSSVNDTTIGADQEGGN
ncbi:MAG: isochorismatase family protein [Elainellaceae cyanobacterium]